MSAVHSPALLLLLAQEAWHLDLTNPPSEAQAHTLDLSMTATGRFNAVIFWYEVQLYGDVRLITHKPSPYSDCSCPCCSDQAAMGSDEACGRREWEAKAKEGGRLQEGGEQQAGGSSGSSGGRSENSGGAVVGGVVVWDPRGSGSGDAARDRVPVTTSLQVGAVTLVRLQSM